MTNWLSLLKKDKEYFLLVSFCKTTILDMLNQHVAVQNQVHNVPGSTDPTR